MNRLLKAMSLPTMSFRARSHSWRSARNLFSFIFVLCVTLMLPSLSFAEENIIYWDDHHQVRQEKGKDMGLYVDALFKRAREARTYQERWDAYVAIQKEISEELILKEEVIPSATSVIPSAATRGTARDLPSQESARLIAWKEMKALLLKAPDEFLNTTLGSKPSEEPFIKFWQKAIEDIEFSRQDGFQFSWLVAPHLPTKTGGLWMEKVGDAYVEQGNFLRAYASYKSIEDHSMAYNEKIEKKLKIVREGLGLRLTTIEKAPAIDGLKLSDGTVFRLVIEKRGMHEEKTPYLEIRFNDEAEVQAVLQAPPFRGEPKVRVIRKRIYDFDLTYLNSKTDGPLLIRDEDKILLMPQTEDTFLVFDLNGMLLEKKPVTEEIASRYETKSIHELLFSKNDFALIPKGAFKMGSPLDEEGRDGDETLHTVKITKDFYLQRTEVTQLQWYVVMGEIPSSFGEKKYCEEEWDEELGICPNHPVERVSWDDVQRFIQKLNALQTKYTYRLPTEAEWEYAARLSGVSEEERRKFLTPDESLDIRESGGANTSYGFGNDKDRLEEYGWYNKNSDSQTHSFLDSRIKPIGGLYNMHGNVWEWVSDRYGAYPTETVIDPKGPQTGSYRVVRGGSWCNRYPRFLWSADRSYGLPGSRFHNVGCRLLRQ